MANIAPLPASVSELTRGCKNDVDLITSAFTRILRIDRFGGCTRVPWRQSLIETQVR